MKISIVVPIYNKKEYVGNCLRSILSQDFDEFEILAVDDGSMDGSGIVCDRIALIDNRLRVFHVENGGVTAARKYGVEQASGSYIMFVDADDMLAPNALRILYDTIVGTGADEVVGSYVTQNGKVRQSGFKGFMDSDFLLKDLLSVRNSFCVTWGLLLKREILKDCLDAPREIVEGEDILMQILILLKKPKVFFIEDVVYHYTEGVPNNRIKSLEMMKLYFSILADSIKPQWKIYEPFFRLFQLKHYEDFLDRKQFEVYDSYFKRLKGQIDSRIPLQDRLVFWLPPRISYILVHTYKILQKKCLVYL